MSVNPTQNLEDILKDPVLFGKIFFDFQPTFYQIPLLRDESKRQSVLWSRQSGKTTTLSVKALWSAMTHPKTLSLVVAPSLRQSMILGDRIQDKLAMLTPKWRDIFVLKPQRTQIRFKNGSQIIILPCSPQLIRGYTAHRIFADEANFFKDDRLVFNNVLYPMLQNTNGSLTLSSTPWNKDSVFYNSCLNERFSKHVCTFEDVIKAGLATQEYFDEIKQTIPLESFQREYMSLFVEDADAWLTQSLIVSCIDANLNLYPFEFNEISGSLYLGADFGKHQDYSVISVIRRDDDGKLRLIHLHRFPLETNYSSVIGYMKSIQDRWNILTLCADITGVGDYIVEDMRHAGLRGVEGINFSVKSKEDIANVFRESMRVKQFLIPYEPTKKATDLDLMGELNVERFELAKTGHIQFSHPQGSHDDVFWSVGLAVYGAVVHRKQTARVDMGKLKV